MPERPGREEIRALVREALRQALPQAAADTDTGTRMGTGSAPGTDARKAAGGESRLAARLSEGARSGGTVEVKVESDGDLAYFAWSLAEAAGHRELAAALADGRLRLRLPAPAPGGAAPGSAEGARTGGAEARVDSGVVNERRVGEIARTHARLALGPRAVLTPLARDRAREVKLDIVRRKP